MLPHQASSIKCLYEVNCTLPSKLYKDYLIWLETHVSEMLKIPGFLTATIATLDTAKANNCQPENSDVSQENVIKNDTSKADKVTHVMTQTHTIVITYGLLNRAALDNYFSYYAEQMRAIGLKQFGEQVTITRRILLVNNLINHVSRT